ncbi:MAG: 4-hydroxy-3-methylbut-2-enyl diphosphate reductase [Elusimicrobiota bacterium]|jgi:4-hydroxy-3-methylbut-2-enyl diphosphate reductase
MKVILVRPRGFCAGVVRAIDIVDIALKKYPHPIYVRKEIVHNRAVVENFKRRGVIFIDNLQEAPEGSLVIFSAHGVPPAVREEARQRHVEVIDATCPLVTKVHLEVHKYARDGYSIILIGHKEHDEVIGTTGEAPDNIQVVSNVQEVSRLKVLDPAKVICLTQTTLSVDETRNISAAIKKRFPEMLSPAKDDVCYATQNRQDAVKELISAGIDLLLVVGSRNSSNSIRLCEVARAQGVESHLIDNASEIKPEWLAAVDKVGLTAGASAPEYLVEEVEAYLKQRGASIEELEVIKEDVSFALPRELLSLTTPL